MKIKKSISIKELLFSLLIICLSANSALCQTVNTIETNTQAIPATLYTFIGNGSWFDPSNWENNSMPPPILKGGEQIIINGKGNCLFSNRNVFFIPKGSSIEIKPGNVFYVSIGTNLILKGGTLKNYGTVKVLSGVLNTKNIDTSTGKFQLSIIPGGYKNPASSGKTNNKVNK